MKTRLRNTSGALVALTAAGHLAVSQVGGYEGLKLYAYRDVIGVWTACYGETKGIHAGMKFSKADCNNMLVDSLITHEQGMRACMTAPDSLPINQYVAELSLAYNIGTGAFCKSTVLKQTNAGNRTAACNAIPMFNKAGGHVIAGLVARRAKEQALCLKS